MLVAQQSDDYPRGSNISNALRALFWIGVGTACFLTGYFFL